MKIALLFDSKTTDTFKREKIDRLVEIVKSHFELVSFETAKRIIVIGGDGFMTHCLRTYAHLRIPFWGINCGTIGFLLNEFTDADDLISSVHDSEYIKFPLLHITAHHHNGRTSESLAFNDMSTDTEPGQAAKHIIEVNGENIIEKMYGSKIFIGDGLIVTTPGGCTAYNMAAGGLPILARDNIFGITPVSPSLPHRTVFHPFAVSNDAVITIHMLEDEKRRHAAIADNVVFKDVAKVVVRRADDYVKVGFAARENYYLKALRFFSLTNNGGTHG